MNSLKILLVCCGLASVCAVAEAQDTFVYRPNFARKPYGYRPSPAAATHSRYVYRDSFVAPWAFEFRPSPYEAYYLRRHNELPPFGYSDGYHGYEIRHLRR